MYTAVDLAHAHWAETFRAEEAGRETASTQQAGTAEDLA